MDNEFTNKIKGCLNSSNGVLDILFTLELEFISKLLVIEGSVMNLE